MKEEGDLEEVDRIGTEPSCTPEEPYSILKRPMNFEYQMYSLNFQGLQLLGHDGREIFDGCKL